MPHLKLLCWIGIHKTRRQVSFEGDLVHCCWCDKHIARIWKDRILKMQRFHILVEVLDE